ncbi:hypothetical protein [Winogradskyella sp. 3972H.M.0a.05]|uniref:hypothetical protein n=1 Tax=Winogradskyella sp. 3972H.M.0a.05 TaxID=2950277 RepID=UPI003390F555
METINFQLFNLIRTNNLKLGSSDSRDGAQWVVSPPQLVTPLNAGECQGTITANQGAKLYFEYKIEGSRNPVDFLYVNCRLVNGEPRIDAGTGTTDYKVSSNYINAGPNRWIVNIDFRKA